MTTWDPAHYERFADERFRPGRDLIARIEHPSPELIVDLGCGTGRLTEELAARWPDADVLGIDRSAEMLPSDSARVRYRLADIETWEPDRSVDLIYANASLHWIPDHPSLMDRLAGFLTPGGALAIQMPLSWDQPSHRVLRTVAQDFGVDSLPPPTLDPAGYYPLFERQERCDVWVTTYLHVLSGDNPVYDWVSATGMQRFIKRIDDSRHDDYRGRCAAEIQAAYPRGEDGTTLFPFTRLFILARA